MSEYLSRAIEVLEKGAKEKMGDQKADAMKKFVAETLQVFCRQDAEFAQAVVQGGSFKDCMKAVAGKAKGNHISDIAAYRAAVGFYFPGATINFQMTIDLCGSVADKKPEKAEPEAEQAAGAKVLNLEDFL